MINEPSMADPLGPIVEQFTDAVRAGKRPRIDDYLEQYPEHADQLRQVLPVLAMMESAKEETIAPQVLAGPASGARRRRFGGYRIFREIGRGGMGVVYEAEQESLGRHVALKVLPHHMASDSQMVARFQREARAAAQLHHTNIVPVFEVGHDDDTYYYAMQFIRGMALDQVLDQIRAFKGEGQEASSIAKEDRLLSGVAQSLWTGSFSTNGLAKTSCELVGADSVALVDDEPHTLPLKLKSPLSESSDEAAPSRHRREPANDAEDRIKSVLRQATVFSRTPDPADASSGRHAPMVQLPGEGNLSLADDNFESYARCVARIGQQVASALGYAHERGIIHRDIKPSNLLLDASGVVWVSDFGLAKTVEDGLTQSGHMLGTLRYMAPERFDGQCNLEGDIYSLGATLFEMLTLRPVFESKDRLELIRKISETEPARPTLLEPRIPRDLETIILKAMDKEPRRRYRSATSLAADLGNFLNDEPIWARRIALHERFWRWAKRNRGTAAALSTIALLLVAFAMVAGWAANHYRRLVSDQMQLAADKSDLADEMSGLYAVTDRERRDAIAARQEAQRNLYYSQIHVAAQAWETHRGLQRMRTILKQWQPKENAVDYRGWEWYYLWGLLQRNVRMIPVQGRNIAGASYNPESGDIAAGTEDGIVRVWDSRTGRVTYGYRAHLRDVLSVAWSPDGRLIATAGSGGALRVHDPVQQSDLPTPQTHSDDIHCVAWSRDGNYLASASADGTIHVWSIANPDSVTVLSAGDKDKEDASGLRSVAWSPDGQRLAGAGDDGLVLIWDRESGELVQQLSGHQRAVRAVDWSSDGATIASAGDDHTVRLWNAQDGRLLRVFEGHSHIITALQWHPQQPLLATAGYDQTLRLWDIQQASEVRTLRGHENAITSMAWSSDGRYLVSAAGDRTLRIWDATTELESFTYRQHQGAYAAAAAKWDPRGNRIASAAADDTLHIWEPGQSEPIFRLAGHDGAVRAIAWHPSGDRVASGGDDGTLRIWNTRTGDPIQTVKKFDASVQAVEFDTTGNLLAAAGADGTVVILESVNLKQVTLAAHHQGPVSAMCWKPGASEVATAGEDQVIVVWDARTGNELRRLTAADTTILALAWSPDGNLLASCGSDGAVRVWDLQNDSLRHLLVGHSDWVLDAVWSPAGDRLATSSVDATIRIWDVEAGAETVTMQGHDRAIGAVDWSSDGMRLVSASEDATVRVWDAFPGYADQRSTELLAVLERRIQENPNNVSDLELRRNLRSYYGQVELAREDRQRIIELYESQLEEGQFLGGVAERLAAVLLENEEEWSVLEPVEYRSDGGATLIRLPDDSLLAEGFNPDWDQYTVRGKVSGARVTAVRLEAIPDARLPGGGSGRFSSNGNFHLSELRASGLAAGQDDPVSLYFIRAASDYSSRQHPVENTIDGDVATSWDIWPSQTDRHVAVFELSDPWELSSDDGSVLQVVLEFRHPHWMSHNLGRLRLSVTSSPRPVLREQLRVYLQSAQLDGRIKLAGAYYLAGQFERAETLLPKMPERADGDNGFAIVLRALVSRELGRSDAAQLRRAASEWMRAHDVSHTVSSYLHLPE